MALLVPTANCRADDDVRSATLRESDQASLIDGALQLQNGQPKRGADFYNYDKQYLSYWLCEPPGASVATPASADPVLRWASLVSGSIALTGFWVLWIAWLRRPSLPGLIAAAAFFFSPLALLSAAPASAATISAGFLLCLIALLSSSANGVWRRYVLPVAAPLLVFAAVAARADAVLCLPLLCWASFRGRSWRHFRSRPRFWTMAIAALVALLLGRWLVDEATTSFYGAFFEPRVFAAYLVFGLGGCGLWWLLQVVALTAATRHRFYWLGALFLLLPLLFYGWQLFSPRHLMTTGLVALGGGFLWKGRALFRLWRRRRPKAVRGSGIAVAAATVLPLMVGIYLPFPSSPRPVFVSATEFPTADGHWPMGATLSFLSRMRRADLAPIDHNQAVWRAARDADLSGCNQGEGPVPIMESDMRAYLMLAARFHGRPSEIVSWQSVVSGEVPCAFVDERALRVRSGGSVHGADGKASVADFVGAGLGMGQVSPADDGSRSEVIVRLSRDGPVDPAIAERLAVAELFAGDEFVAIDPPANTWQPGKRDGGKSVAFSSRSEFSANGRKAQPKGEWWLLRFSGAEVQTAGQITLDGGDSFKAWLGVLPDYMSRSQPGPAAVEAEP